MGPEDNVHLMDSCERLLNIRAESSATGTYNQGCAKANCECAVCFGSSGGSAQLTDGTLIKRRSRTKKR